MPDYFILAYATSTLPTGFKTTSIDMGMFLHR